MDESEAKSITNDVVVLVSNESQGNSVQNGNNDTSANNVCVKKGVTDEGINQNEHADILPAEKFEVVKNGSVVENNDCLTPNDEIEEKEEVENMEKDVIKSVKSEAAEIENVPVLDTNNELEQVEEDKKAENIVEVTTEEIMDSVTTSSLQPEHDCSTANDSASDRPIDDTILPEEIAAVETNDNVLDEKQDLPEKTDKDIEILDQPIQQKIVESPISNEEGTPSEIKESESCQLDTPDVQEESVNIVADDIKIDEPAGDENSGDTNIVSQDTVEDCDLEELQKQSGDDSKLGDNDENTTVSTSMVSHMVLSPEDNSGPSKSTEEEHAEVTNTHDDVVVESQSLGESQQTSAIENIEDVEIKSVDDDKTLKESECIAAIEESRVVVDTIENDSQCTSMVSHLVSSPCEPSVVNDDKESGLEIMPDNEPNQDSLGDVQSVPPTEQSEDANIDEVKVEQNQTLSEDTQVPEANVVELESDTSDLGVKEVENETLTEIQQQDATIMETLPSEEIENKTCPEIEILESEVKLEAEGEQTENEVTQTASEELAVSESTVKDLTVEESDKQTDDIIVKDEEKIDAITCTDVTETAPAPEIIPETLDEPNIIDKDQISKEEDKEMLEGFEVIVSPEEKVSELTEVHNACDGDKKEEKSSLEVQTNETLLEEEVISCPEPEKERFIVVEDLREVEQNLDIQLEEDIEKFKADNKEPKDTIKSAHGDAKSDVEIPIISEKSEVNIEEIVDTEPPQEILKENVLETISTNNDAECSDQDPSTKIEHSKDETIECSVEKEVIESEGGSKIERTKTCQEQIIRETKKQTTVSETVEQLTPEELFERFPELRGTILNETSESSKSDVVEGGKGTFEDPKTVTSNQEESRVSSSTCPEDKDATMITISSSSLTKQTMKASSSSRSGGPNEEKEATGNKVPSPPARKKHQDLSEKKLSESEDASKKDKEISPNVVNVPINVEGDCSIPESTNKELVSTSAQGVETKSPEEVITPVPPPRSTNPQANPICCTIL